MRLYKIGKNGKAMSGTAFVSEASRLFTSEVHGWGRYGRPTNIKKAIGFVARELRRDVYTKLESEKEWSYA